MLNIDAHAVTRMRLGQGLMIAPVVVCRARDEQVRSVGGRAVRGDPA